MEKFRYLVERVGSAQNKARLEYKAFKNQKHSLTYVVETRGRGNKKQEEEDVIQFLL